MFLRLAIAVTLLALTIAVDISVQSKRDNSNPATLELALVPPQDVSVNEKKKVLTAIKSLYGAQEKVTVNDPNFLIMSSKYGLRRGVVLREKNGKLYLLANPCDRDWSEMDIYVYSKPYEIKRGVEKRYCEMRKITVTIAEVKQN